MQFQKGHKLAKGGNHGGGRPTKEQAEAKAAMRKAAMDKLCGSMGKAIQAMLRHLSSVNETISLRAAEDIVEYALKSMEAEELESRIAALEARLQQEKQL